MMETFVDQTHVILTNNFWELETALIVLIMRELKKMGRVVVIFNAKNLKESILMELVKDAHSSSDPKMEENHVAQICVIHDKCFSKMDPVKIVLHILEPILINNPAVHIFAQLMKRF